MEKAPRFRHREFRDELAIHSIDRLERARNLRRRVIPRLQPAHRSVNYLTQSRNIFRGCFSYEKGHSVMPFAEFAQF